MARMFYLSLVHHNNMYLRYDMLKFESLKELDKIIANYDNREQILKAYYPNYEKGKHEGKVCIVYEDLNLKDKYLKEIEGLSPDRHEELLRYYDYAHIIPILYKGKEMISIPSCIYSLKARKNNSKVIDAIMFNVLDKNGDVVFGTNKRYIFEVEEEKQLIEKESKYREALDLFAKRVKTAREDDQYFYFRSLLNILNLSISTIKTQAGNIRVREENMKDSLIDGCNLDRTMRYRDIMTETDKLIDESTDMEEFYLWHDLDEVIRLSPWKKRPIGSKERK